MTASASGALKMAYMPGKATLICLAAAYSSTLPPSFLAVARASTRVTPPACMEETDPLSRPKIYMSVLPCACNSEAGKSKAASKAKMAFFISKTARTRRAAGNYSNTIL